MAPVQLKLSSFASCAFTAPANVIAAARVHKIRFIMCDFKCYNYKVKEKDNMLFSKYKKNSALNNNGKH